QEENGHIALVVEGPVKDFTVRQKGRTLGLWTNIDSRKFENVPGYYEIATAVPLADLGTADILTQHRLGIANLPIHSDKRSNANSTLRFREAFVKRQQDHALYIEDIKGVSYISPSLFKARFQLPAEVPSGQYTVRAYLFSG